MFNQKYLDGQGISYTVYGWTLYFSISAIWMMWDEELNLKEAIIIFIILKF